MPKQTKQNPLRAPSWELFFKDQRHPVMRSQLITALMAGKPLVTERVPVPTLLDVVLLSFASRVYHEAEIVDDFHALLRLTDETWKAPMWTRRVFDQTHMNAANYVLKGVEEFACYEEQYIPDMVRFYLENDVPEYFSKELTR